MKKHNGFYYTTRIVDYVSRNNVVAMRLYGWAIWGKDRKILDSSFDVAFEDRDSAEFVAKEHIDLEFADQ